MFRWLNPFIFAGAAVYVRHYNADHETSQLLFPGVQSLTDGDMFAAGTLTWQLLFGLAVLLGIWAIGWTIWDRRKRGDEDEDA